MPSSFPGMDPYLEQADAWEDFHGHYIVGLAEALNRLVGANYFVKIEVRLYLRELGAEERRYFGRADAGVATSEISGASPTTTVTTAPVRLELPAVETERQSYLEIRDRRNRRLVTVIELLSPSNKAPGADRDEYLGKRREVLASQAHFIEIDLRRGGVRPELPRLPVCDYYILVSRSEERPTLGMWPVGLRDRLPIIPTPLAAPDPDVALDLQGVLDRVYDAAGYAKYIYSGTPEPPLSAADAAWAVALVPQPD